MSGCCAAQVEPGQLPHADHPKLADVFRRYGPKFLASRRVPPEQASALNDMIRCRTPALGGYLERCGSCGHTELRYNSCSNRNCPTCQWLRQQQWTLRQLHAFLLLPHHQVVCTLTGKLRPLARANDRLVYALMMRVATETIAQLVRQRYNAEVGQVAVLHTWNRELDYHPHVHNTVSCGGLDLVTGKWVTISKDFLVPIEQLRTAFRRNMIRALIRAFRAGQLHLPGALGAPGAFARLIRLSSRERWIVYIEAPIGQVSPMVRYLAQYVNRVGMSNSRLVAVNDDRVTFQTRKDQTLTLDALDFIGRYLQHVVPKGFHRVRHYGLYSPSARKARLPQARSLVPIPQRVQTGSLADGADAAQSWEDLMTALTGRDPRCCPICDGPIDRTPFGKPRLGTRRARASATTDCPPANTS